MLIRVRGQNVFVPKSQSSAMPIQVAGFFTQAVYVIIWFTFTIYDKMVILKLIKRRFLCRSQQSRTIQP